MTEQAKR